MHTFAFCSSVSFVYLKDRPCSRADVSFVYLKDRPCSRADVCSYSSFPHRDGKLDDIVFTLTNLTIY